MSWVILIDGYNVLLNWPQFSEAVESAFDQARERLLRTVADYAHYHGHRAIVVFDAPSQNQRRAKREKRLGLEIVYTRKQQTADAYIIGWLERYTGNAHVEVITSDVELRQAAQRLGASVRNTFEFSDSYTQARKGVRFVRPQDAIPNSDPQLADRLDANTRRQLEQLKRRLKKP